MSLDAQSGMQTIYQFAGVTINAELSLEEESSVFEDSCGKECRLL